MKKSLLTLALGSLCASSAFAQTSVTLYGIADAAVHYTTNADASNHGQLALDNGAVTQSRWGLKGAEALGNNLKAIFQLENGYNLDNGTMSSSGQLFNRQAYVGLAGDFGAVKLGRQYTEGFNLFGDFDPLTIGNWNGNSWMYYSFTQLRRNNVISYSGSFSGLDVGLSYGFGETPGSFTRASGSGAGTNSPYFGARLAYNWGPFGVGGVYQEIRDGNGNKQQMWGATGKYTVGPAKLFLGYLGAKDHTGQMDAVLNNALVVTTTRWTIPTTTGTAAADANPRKDTLGFAGVTYNVTPALALTGAFYGDFVEGKNGIAGSAGKGRRYTAAFIAEYSLSKRTQVYGAADWNKVSGATEMELPGRGNQTSFGAGVRHIF